MHSAVCSHADIRGHKKMKLTNRSRPYINISHAIPLIYCVNVFLCSLIATQHGFQLCSVSGLRVRVALTTAIYRKVGPDSNVHGANMGPTWGWQTPGGPHVDRMNFAIWGVSQICNVTHRVTQTRELLFQIMGCYLLATRLPPDSMLVYCYFDLSKQIVMKFELKYFL